MNISIRKFEKRDIPNKIKWINDKRNNQYLHYDLPLEYDKTLHWFIKNKDRSDRYDAVIEANGTPVGLIGLLAIDKKNRKAEYYIAIGDQEFKGKGVGIIASKLILEYAFDKLKLNKVYLFTELENIKAQRLFEKVGFRKEGVLKKDIKGKNGFVDRYVYGICKEGFYNNRQIGKRCFISSKIVKLSKKLNNNTFFIKRDDLLPVSFGGNKARKAILFFDDIAKTSADCIVTYGSSGSNHCRVIANLAASKDLQCHIITPKEKSKSTSNSKMINLFGANTLQCSVTEVSNTIEKVIKRLKDQGHKPYFIPGGGHGNIGTQAYVDAYEEIVRYEKNTGINFDYIFHASGTGTTQAGLVCGVHLNNNKKSIVGISIARKNPHGGQVVYKSVNDYLQNICNDTVNINEINFVDDYILEGYGTYNKDILQTIREVITNDGIPMDTTYTGKAYWGMEEYIKKNGIQNKNILFIHTGGTPLFFDDLEELLI